MKSSAIPKIISLFLLFSGLNAQIKGVKYQLKFNAETQLFDCYLKINQGSATSLKDRVQFNAQYTIMVPSGSSVEIAENHMPLQNNQKYEGTKPLKWVKANEVKRPASDPFNDYISIIPTLSPAAFYNDLKEGDQIKLFSLSISPVSNCGNDIKIFENGIDLDSGSRGMGGGDFSNGFTIGGVEQKYLGNDEAVLPSAIAVKSLKASNKNGIELNTELLANPQYLPFHFEWRGPDNFRSKEKDIKIAHPSTKDYGTYTLIVSDARGCKQTLSLDVAGQELAVQDKTKDVSLLDNKVTSNYTKSDNKLSIGQNIKIFPNPVFNNFNLTIEDKVGSTVKVDMFDANGRLVRKNIINTTLTSPVLESNIIVEDITPGIYTLAVNISEKESKHKIIVVR